MARPSGAKDKKKRKKRVIGTLEGISRGSLLFGGVSGTLSAASMAMLTHPKNKKGRELLQRKANRLGIPANKLRRRLVVGTGATSGLIGAAGGALVTTGALAIDPTSKLNKDIKKYLKTNGKKAR